MGMMKALAEQVLRACNPDEIQASDPGSTLVLDDAIALAMPLLLDKGIVASSMEARGFSFGMLVKIIKISRAALKDWLVRLVGVLVESMSALEPQMLQYMQFHTARLQISDEELETMRLRLAKESPMQEALDGCLQALGGMYSPLPLSHIYTHLHTCTLISSPLPRTKPSSIFQPLSTTHSLPSRSPQ